MKAYLYGFHDYYIKGRNIKCVSLANPNGKNKDNGILLAAHADTLGAMVSEIKGNGNLKVSPLGGMNPNNAEAENCRIVTRFNGTYEGTFQLNNASVHVNANYSDAKRKYTDMEVVLDEVVNSKADTENLGIMVGDIVCFDPRTHAIMHSMASVINKSFNGQGMQPTDDDMFKKRHFGYTE